MLKTDLQYHVKLTKKSVSFFVGENDVREHIFTHIQAGWSGKDYEELHPVQEAVADL